MTVNKITNAPTQNETIEKINEIIDNLGGGGITVDSALSTTSTNPVQNKVIASRINTINTLLSQRPEGLTTQFSVAVGQDTNAGNGSIVIGNRSFQNSAGNNITIGDDIQVLDYSTNNKFIVGDQQGNGGYYEMLDLQTGIIPDARISTNIARTSDIPTVNNATLTIQKNGTTVDTFTANASSNVTANITVPTATSDLTNDSGFITGISSSDVTTALGYTPYNSSNPNGYTSNTGTVTSVNNTSPDNNGNVTLSIPDAQVNSDWNASSGVAQILNKPSLATVATSGSYTDLTNKPTIPSGDFASKDMCIHRPTTSSTATTDKPTVVVENYLNGASWYRIWSDGFKEQGGYNNNTSASDNFNVSLIKTMISTNYYVNTKQDRASYTGTGTPNWRSVFRNINAVVSKTTSSFNVQKDAFGFYWYVCGY